MKLAVGITVFNGLELLDRCVDNYEPMVDNIIICWQKVSNTGNVSTEVEPAVRAIREKYPMKVSLVEYFPSTSVNTKENERQKHNLMLAVAKSQGCSHFLLSATDHFYHRAEFEFGIHIIDTLKYDVTFTKLFTYYKHPTWRLTPIEDYYCPFIMNLEGKSYERRNNYPLLVDPSLKVNTCNNFYLFKDFEIMMHHYSMVRNDIQNKFDNAAARIRWTTDQIKQYREEFETYDLETNPGIAYFKGRKIKEVPNLFGL
jgi:hypothetical protein